MNRSSAPRSIDEYLKQLRAALEGEDPALIQDALYDAEEYLRGGPEYEGTIRLVNRPDALKVRSTG